MLGEHAAILPHGPVDRLVGVHAACDLCAQVREHERSDDLLDRRRERSRATRKANEARKVLEDLELGIPADDRHRLAAGVAEEAHAVATPTDHRVLPDVSYILDEAPGRGPLLV